MYNTGVDTNPFDLVTTLTFVIFASTPANIKEDFCYYPNK